MFRVRSQVRLAAAVSLLGCAVAAAAQGPTPAWCEKLPRPAYAHLMRVPSPDPWFEVYQVAPDVFAIYEPHQWEETISYLILGRDRAALLDTGMGIGNLPLVVHSLTKLPIVVLNSHTHNDHVGGNWQFDTVYSMDTPYTRAHAAGSAAYAAEVKSEIAPQAICGALPPAFDKVNYQTRPWKVARWLHDGDTVDLGGRSLEVLLTPGHAPDEVVVLDRANGLMFTGDNCYNGPIYVFGPGADALAFRKTVHEMATLSTRMKLLLPEHNEPVAEPSVLPALAAAYEAVLAGKAVVSAGEEPGVSAYTANGFRFMVDPKLLEQAKAK